MNLIFPVAGEAIRFGGTFKPFLKIGDISFIESTINTSFKKWIDSGDITKIYFICTKAQEKEYDVTKNINDFFPLYNPQVIVIDEKTDGPYQTLKLGIEKAKITGKSIVCDCDHALDVDHILNTDKKDIDCIIPTWDIHKDEWMNWSKIILDKNKPKMICEKERIDSEDYDVKGIIGCIYFKQIEKQFKSKEKLYVSESLQDLIYSNSKIETYNPKWADFYGDEKMLENHVNNLRKKMSIFCDIDGVLLKHNPHSTSNIEDNETIFGFEKLREWKNDGHKIIITTARNKKYIKETKKLLDHYDIPYDDIVTSLTAGPRVLINDSKPSKPFTNQVVPIELQRDLGLKDANLDFVFHNYDSKIQKEFEGGSFAKIYLLENNVVRKVAIKDQFLPPIAGPMVGANVLAWSDRTWEVNVSNMTKVSYQDRMARQRQDMLRFNFLWPGSAPQVISYKDSASSYSYDMEYLDGYQTLSSITDQNELKKAVGYVLKGMKENIYCVSKEINGSTWIQDWISRKLYTKFNQFLFVNNNGFHFLKSWHPLIQSDIVTINNKKYFGLKTAIHKIDKRLIMPKSIRPIHGDFTYQNIMWNGTQTKLIDPDGSDIFDCAEQDLAKMCQFAFARFDEWKDDVYATVNKDGTYSCTEEFFNIDLENDVTKHIIKQWSLILNDDESTVVNKGIFYLAAYFLRFTPFRAGLGHNHALFALIMSVVYFNKLIKNEN